MNKPKCWHEGLQVRWWKSIYNVWACGMCHPPAVERLVSEWIDAPYAPQSLATHASQDLMADPERRIPQGDLLAMWFAFMRNELKSPVLQKVRQRLAWKWNETGWHFVALTEKEAKIASPKS